jgi:HD superfamily phosphodiesterase
MNMEGDDGMSRIKDLQKQVYKILEKMDDPEKQMKAISHLHGVALAAAVLAKKRGEDAELATMAGMMHDLYAYKSGSYDEHEKRGAELARVILEKLDVTTEEETDIICSAISHHGDKAEVHAPMDEILKDADVIDHSLSDPTKEVKAHERTRYAKLCAELGLAD